jgi:hypothetical protein
MNMEKIPVEEARPRPPIQNDQDWRPNPNERETGSFFWEIFTGHSKVFGQKDIEMFIDINDGKIILPSSELSFDLDTSYQGLLHLSWLGICHNLTRIYIFDEDGFTKLQDTLNTKGISFEPLVSGLGIKVNTKIPTFVKNAKTAGGIDKNETEGTVLFLKEQALKTPADALDLVVEIAKLNPNTFEELMSSVLIRTRIVSHNILVWRKVLADYEAGKFSELLSIYALPQEFKELFDEIKSYLQQIPDALVEFEQKLAEKFTGLEVVPLKEIKNPPLMLMDEAIALGYLQQILKIIAKLQVNTTETEKPEKREIALNRLNRLKKDILTRNFHENTEAVNTAYAPAYDPRELLLMVTMRTGQELMLNQMGPSDVMIYEFIKSRDQDFLNKKCARDWNTLIHKKYEMVNQQAGPKVIANLQKKIDQLRQQLLNLWIQKKIDQLRQQLLNLWNNKHPDQPIPTSVREWVERMGIKTEMTQLRNELAQAEAELVTTEEKEAYLRVSEAVARKIQTIMQAATVERPQENLKWYEFYVFPSHPVLNRWEEVEQTINEAINDLNFELSESDKGDLANKVKAIFQAKRKLAEKQAHYTNLFLKTTTKYMTGGYDGWDEAKRGLTIFLESFPYSAARLKELNCVSITILLSAMLRAAGVFEEEEDLVAMSTYNHILLGGVDVLNVSRAIEGSGYPIHSYYYYSTYRNNDRNKVFYGQVFGKKQIIRQLSLSVGLLTSLGINYSLCLAESEVKVLLLKLLQTSGYIGDNLWYRLSNFCQSYTDLLLCLSRAISINHFYLIPLVELCNLFYKNKDKILAELGKDRDSPLLEYIKLNLLIIQKALTEFQFKPEFNKNIGKIKFVIKSLLSNLNLENVQIPPFWQKKYGSNLERATIEQMITELSNQNLFPKPISFNNEGRIIWQMPD